MKPETFKHIAPKLSSLRKLNNGFKVPEGYFKSVEDTVMSNIVEAHLPKQLAKNSFKTPEVYFDGIEDLVIARLKAEKLQQNNPASTEVPESYFETIESKVFSRLRQQPKVISFEHHYTKIVAVVAVAASLTLFVILNNFNNTLNTSFESIASSDIELWIQNENIDIDAFELSDIYSDVKLENNIFEPSYSEDEALEYLNNVNVELMTSEN